MTCLVAILAAAAAPLMGAGAPPEIFGSPPEVVAHQAELIVVGEAASLEPPRQLTVTLPGGATPVKRFYSRCQIVASRVVKAAPADSGLKLTKGSRFWLEVLALPRGAGRGDSPQAMLPVLRSGGRYLLLLRRFPQTGRWFLPYGRQNCMVPSAEAIREIVAAMRLDDWPWGRAANGLQIAMICKWKQWGHMIRGRQTIFFRTFLALRNSSRKALTVNLRPDDAPLWIEARNAGGQVVRAEVYRLLKWRLGGELPKPAEKLQPGEVIFVCTTGKQAIQVEASMDLAAGPWMVYAGYKNERAKTEEGAAPLWTGQAVAKPLAIEVLKKDTGGANTDMQAEGR
jgi:hypothetical protein